MKDEFENVLKYFDSPEDKIQAWICPAVGKAISAETCMSNYLDALDDIDVFPDHECLVCELKPVRKYNKKKIRGNVLETALRTINGARQDVYGKPEDSFAIIGGFWATYLGVDITARQVAEMMMLFKIARMKGQKSHADNYVDCAGYCGIAADLLEDER